MYVAEGLDSGDILLQKSLPVRHRETGGSLHDRLARLAPEALGSALEMLIQGEATDEPGIYRVAAAGPTPATASPPETPKRVFDKRWMPAVTGLRFEGMRGSAGLGRCGAAAGC